MVDYHMEDFWEYTEGRQNIAYISILICVTTVERFWHNILLVGMLWLKIFLRKVCFFTTGMSMINSYVIAQNIGVFRKQDH